jgi:hypothetical protein
MREEPESPEKTPQNAAERRYREVPQPKFNPFANEDDMFKVVLAVGAAVLLLIALAVLIRSIL